MADRCPPEGWCSRLSTVIAAADGTGEDARLDGGRWKRTTAQACKPPTARLYHFDKLLPSREGRAVPGENWERLYEVALDQYGYATSQDARDLGIDVVQLGIMHSRGQLEHIDYGLYRFPQVPTSGRDAFMEAVLWVGRDASLSHDAVLALHDLGFANPRTIRVVTSHRVRRRHPRADITIVRDDIPDKDLTAYHRIPSTTVARALIDARDLIMPSRLRDAADTAREQGLLLADEYQRVLADLDPVS